VKALRAHDVVPEAPLPDEDPLRLMTIGEVARELRCSRGHVQNLIRGRVPRMRPLPSIPVGRRRLILLSSFRNWVRANEQIH
jgi:excisionase family DNA binding protein